MAASNSSPILRGSSEIDGKFVQEVSHAETAIKPDRGMEAPPLVRDLTPEGRIALEKKLKRKIDLRLMPMAILMYIMNYLDRNNIAAVRLAGLQTELRLTSVQYQTTVSILFVGYILMQIPSNLLLNKIGLPAVYLPSCMVVWGIVSGATAGCHNYGGLLAIRFFLGFVEAAYFPGCLFYLSSWYTRKELGFRTAILYSGSLLSGAFGGLITAGITGNMDGTAGLRAWRWVFIIEGAITVVIASAAFFILPNFPRTTKWLTEEERQLAVWRLQEDIGEDDWVSSSDQSFFHGLKLAVLDIKVWILMVMLLGTVSSASVTNFFPTVVATLGYGRVETLLLTSPPYVLAVICTFVNAWHADRTGERFYHVILPAFVGIAAFIIAAATTNTAARYLSMMLMLPGVYTGYVVQLAWISNCIPRPPDKRAASLALVNAVSNASSIYASYMYPQPMSGEPIDLVVPMSVDCATLFLAVCMAVLLRFILVRLNKRLDRGEHVEGAINSGAAIPGEAASKGFRFLL
ncbi:MFS general substrate transporter [Pseudovirgaria hyperparasitica]|uniref:MFS general substrate transporter n=1 Tax=Pseudovirgaria hyperparasitica TaxID=470096 RepID=A0A6A6W2F5_9PEZI|nr:MFS general substrate transporter [Pseudovirgaria hyperparasitica]KAF2757108.1 MFS general substrate transporter [Pseudovirgaria hyperparasitica]